MSDGNRTIHLPRSITRRDVVRAAVLSAGIVALGPLGRQRSEALGAPRSNFKRLVVINLDGGADTLHAVVPVGLSGYYTARGTLAMQKADTLAVNGTTLYALHPQMPSIRDLWNAGDALAVQRVGYPNENLSHFESQDIFSWGVRNGFSNLHIKSSGWIARYADRNAATPLGAVSIGMGRPLTFTGGTARGLTVSSLAAFKLTGSASRIARINAARALIRAAPVAGLAAEAKDALGEAYDLVDQVQEALAAHDQYVATNGLAWPTSTIAQRLRDVAALIHGGFETRIFYTGFSGFDTHVQQGTTGTAPGTLGSLLSQLDGAIGAFAAEMEALGVWEDVAIVVITEFGRRSYKNGSGGTDHGHGFAELVLGGAVDGGRSLGPDLTDNDLVNSKGYVGYAVDFRSVYKELVRDHLGADPAPVFPEALQIETTLGLL